VGRTYKSDEKKGKTKKQKKTFLNQTLSFTFIPANDNETSGRVPRPLKVSRNLIWAGRRTDSKI
jgi:hypothetical protein